MSHHVLMGATKRLSSAAGTGLDTKPESNLLIVYDDLPQAGRAPTLLGSFLFLFDLLSGHEPARPASGSPHSCGRKTRQPRRPGFHSPSENRPAFCRLKAAFHASFLEFEELMRIEVAHQMEAWPVPQLQEHRGE
jgi:hypothetical protein